MQTQGKPLVTRLLPPSARPRKIKKNQSKSILMMITSSSVIDLIKISLRGGRGSRPMRTVILSLIRPVSNPKISRKPSLRRKGRRPRQREPRLRLVMAMMMPRPVARGAYLPMISIWKRRGAMLMTLKLINALVLPRGRPMLIGLGLSESQLSPYLTYLCGWVWTKWPLAE